jgi:hypothetical protein
MQAKRILIFCLSIAGFLASCKKNTPETAAVDCAPAHTKMDTAVLLVLGQSNAANFGKTTYTAGCPNAMNFYDGNFYPLSDPLHGANGDGGSVWSRLGDGLIQNGFAKVVIIAPASIGGTSIRQWKPGGEYNHLIAETILSLRLKGLKITHVLWHQGENDNTYLNPQSTADSNAQKYRRDFLELVAQLRSLNVDAPVFPAIVSRCGDVPADISLQQAQRSLAVDSLRIYNGPNTDLLGNEYRYDGCHFNDLGLRVHALLWQDILFNH